jgi:RNA polymerase sigma-70 factor (ECF subfamily)
VDPPTTLPAIAPSPDDADLVRRAQAGDRRALEDLLRLHHPRIHTVCRRMLGQEADALDATQDTLIAITTRLHRYDGRAAFGTWCYRVAVNTCLDELRRRGRRPVVPGDEVLLQGAVGDHGFADRVTDGMVVEEALARLAPEFRACVVLRDVCGLDYAEIGETLGLKPGTVRSRIARGRGALARMLGNQDDPRDVQGIDDEHA